MGTRERWIGQLKSTGEAPLDTPLMQELERANDAALGRCKTLCVAAVLIVCVLGAVVLAAPKLGLASASSAIIGVSVIMSLLVCLAAGSSAVHARRVRRMAALVREDGRVERFVLSPARVEGLTAAKALGLVPRGVEPGFADIYCATRTLARVDSQCAPFDHPKVMVPVEVWEAERSEEDGSPPPLRGGPGLAEAGRSLSEPERSEIGRLLARQREEIAKWSIIAVLSASLGTFTGLELFSSLARGRSFSLGVSVWGLAALAGVACAAFMLVSEVIGRSRLRRSLRDARLARLSEEDIRRESAPAPERGVMVSRAECLRASGIVWTVEGEPADWRTEPGRRSLRNLPRSRTVLEGHRPMT
ncbi:MAG TPA: hypothetical protein VFF65_11680 [Phycisphaerales bacterium]|nr:hypothetical protein [Phycisphaerales bacterium]